jgi:hypothetical protein
MSGINIFCGDFEGEDKSGSAVEGVLNGIARMASAPEQATISRLRSALQEGEDHALIEPADARQLLPLLRQYAAEIDAQLAAPGDPLDQMRRDERQAPDRITQLQYGESLGWRAYCARDLLRACEVADAQSEEVALVW